MDKHLTLTSVVGSWAALVLAMVAVGCASETAVLPAGTTGDEIAAQTEEA